MPAKNLEVKTGLQEGYRSLNYSNADVKINADKIPITIPIKALKEWQKDDPNPYYKIQMIEYPILANRYNYQESFFKSYISKLKDRPIPGSKDGHSNYWGERPDTDFIMVGAKLESNGDGTGKVFFKNYIPVKGEKGSNENFIRENKTDMVHYSLVTYPRIEIYEDEDGEQIINAIESVKGERNDAVEYGLGAMKQTTNSADKNKDLNDLPMASKADLLDNLNKGDGTLKDELLKAINSFKAEAITLDEIAEALGKADQVVTKEHLEAVKIVNSIKELGFKNPIEDVKSLQDKIKTDSEAVLNARLDKEFGTNPEADKKENLLRVYAEQRIANIEGKDLEEKIESIKKDPIALNFAKDKTDNDSDKNKILIVEPTKNIDNNTDAIVVDKI